MSSPALPEGWSETAAPDLPSGWTEAAAPAQEPSVLHQFLAGGKEGGGGGVASLVTGPMNLLAGLATHPIDTVTAAAQSHVAAVKKALDDLEKLKVLQANWNKDAPLGEKVKKSLEALQTAESGVVHTAGAVTPVVGPGLADTITGVLHGDPGSVGEAAGMAAAGPAMRGVSKVAGRLAPAAETAAEAAPESPATVKAGPLTPLQAGETGFRAKLEAGLRNMFTSAGKFEDFLKTEQEPHLAQMANDTLDAVSKVRGNPEQVGKVWQAAQDAAEATGKAQYDDLYNNVVRPKVEAAGKNGYVDITMAKKGPAREMYKELTSNEALVKTPAGNAMKNVLERFMDYPDRVDWEVAKNFRTQMSKIANSVDDATGNLKVQGARKLSDIMDASMTNAAEKGGFYQEWKKADQAFATHRQLWKDGVLKKLGDADPSTVATILGKSSLEDINVAKKVIPPDVFNQASARILEDMIGKASVGTSSGLPDFTKIKGTALGGAQKAFGVDRLKALVGEQGAANLAEVADYARRLRPEANQQIMGRRIGSAANTSMFLGAMGGATGAAMGNPAGLTALGGVAATGAASRLLASALIHQPGTGGLLVKMMSALDRVAKTGGNLADKQLQIPAIALSRALQKEREREQQLVGEAPGTPEAVAPAVP